MYYHESDICQIFLFFQDGSYLAEFLLEKGYEVSDWCSGPVVMGSVGCSHFSSSATSMETDNKSDSGADCAVVPMMLPAHCLCDREPWWYSHSACRSYSQESSSLCEPDYNIIRVNLWCNVLHKNVSQWSHFIRKLHRAIKTKLIFGELECKIYTWRFLLSLIGSIYFVEGEM
jgi:hypothetical protein